MNIAPTVEPLDEADWTVAELAELSEREITEHIESLRWERMHYENICTEFEPDSRQGRYATLQMNTIDIIVARLEAVLNPSPARHNWSSDYPAAS